MEDFAKMLGFKTSSLAFLLYKIPPEKKYTKFTIAKKNGGIREIHAPVEQIKALQRHLANILYACRAEIEREGPQRKPLSHGFRESLSIITNAKPHKNRRFVLNLDIQDFFPSFNFGRVRGFFIKNRDFALNDKIATIIAQIACHENALPQGSPCSPVIADLIAHLLDVRLAQLAKLHGATYSRYADDLTFSTNKRAFPPALAARDDCAGSEWVLGDDLVRAINNAGFLINPSKTRMQCSTGRQLVTGLTVNKKVNIRPEYYRLVRAMCHSLFQTGAYHRDTPNVSNEEKSRDESSAIEKSPALNRFQDILSFIRHLARGMKRSRFQANSRHRDTPKVSIEEKSQEKNSASEKPPTLNELHGMLSHIHFVKDSVDIRTALEKKKKPTAARTLYRNFLYYRYFINLGRPLVVCEGKTDNVYLKLAIRNLADFHPKLGAPSGKVFKSAISFFSYTNSAHSLLNLGGGASDLKFLILRYKKMMKIFKHRPLLHPVIILIDNDKGAKEIFSVLKENFEVTVSLKSADLFYHLTDNLYLVKIPKLGKKDMSCIEDFFAPSLLSTKLDGKKFNPSNSHKAADEYGKTVFAEKVVRPNASKIDFSGFAQILKCIVAVMDHYQPPK